MVLTLILNPLMERGLRQSLEMSDGDFSIFATRPLSLSLLVLAAIVLLMSSMRIFRQVKADSEV